MPKQRSCRISLPRVGSYTDVRSTLGWKTVMRQRWLKWGALSKENSDRSSSVPIIVRFCERSSGCWRHCGSSGNCPAAGDRVGPAKLAESPCGDGLGLGGGGSLRLDRCGFAPRAALPGQGNLRFKACCKHRFQPATFFFHDPCPSLLVWPLFVALKRR